MYDTYLGGGQGICSFDKIPGTLLETNQLLVGKSMVGDHCSLYGSVSLFISEGLKERKAVSIGRQVGALRNIYIYIC